MSYYGYAKKEWETDEQFKLPDGSFWRIVKPGTRDVDHGTVHCRLCMDFRGRGTHFIRDAGYCSGKKKGLQDHQKGRQHAGLIEEMRQAIRGSQASDSEAAAAPTAIPDQAPSGQSSLFSADVAPAKLKPGVYARGRHTQEVATAQLAKVTGGTRAQKLVDTTRVELGVPRPPSGGLASPAKPGISSGHGLGSSPVQQQLSFALAKVQADRKRSRPAMASPRSRDSKRLLGGIYCQHLQRSAAIALPKSEDAGDQPRQQATDTNTLIGELQSLSILLGQLVRDDEGSSQVVKNLTSFRATFPDSAFRAIKGDGNCFYRAFVAAVLEGIQASGNEARIDYFAEALTAAYSALDLPHATPPASNTAAHDGCQQLQDLLKQIKEGTTWEHVLERMWTTDFDLAVLYLLRAITAKRLEGNEDEYAPFISGIDMYSGMSITQIAQEETLPMDKEAESLQVEALASALHVKVVMYVVAGDNHGEAHAVDFGPTDAQSDPSGATPASAAGVGTAEQGPQQIHLLYRPGHYDILYPGDRGLSMPFQTPADAVATVSSLAHPATAAPVDECAVRGCGIFTIPQRGSHGIPWHVPVECGQYTGLYLLQTAEVVCDCEDCEEDATTDSTDPSSAQPSHRRISAQKYPEHAEVLLQRKYSWSNLLQVPGEEHGDRRSCSLHDWMVSNNVRLGAHALEMYIDSTQEGDNSKFDIERQQEWLDKGSPDVYEACANRVVEGFQSHYANFWIGMSTHKAEAESEYASENSGRSLRTFGPGQGGSDLSWQTYNFPGRTRKDAARLLLAHEALGHLNSSVYRRRMRSGVLPVSLRDYRKGSKRQLQFSMVTPLSIYPRNCHGILAALRYENWQPITENENSQIADSKASTYLEHKRKDHSWRKDHASRWLRAFGGDAAEMAGNVNKSQMERMTDMMGYGYDHRALVVDVLGDEPADSDGKQGVDVFMDNYKSKQPARLIPKRQRCHRSLQGSHYSWCQQI